MAKRPIRRLGGSSRSSKPVRHVVAGLILRVSAQGQQEVLICQRRPDQPMASKWEFPGGKVENGETAEAALARELNEELGIIAIVGPRLTTIRHNYRNGSIIEIQFFRVDSFSEALDNRIFQDMRWSALAALPGYDFLAADVSLIRELADGKYL